MIKANKCPLPLVEGPYQIVIDGDERELERTGEDTYEYDGEDIELEEMGDGTYDDMEEFEAAKESGKDALSLKRTATLVLDDTEIEITRD